MLIFKTVPQEVAMHFKHRCVGINCTYYGVQTNSREAREFKRPVQLVKLNSGPSSDRMMVPIRPYAQSKKVTGPSGTIH